MAECLSLYQALAHMDRKTCISLFHHPSYDSINFMIITIPKQVDSFKNRYCTEQNNEHVQHYGIPFYRRSLVGHTEYEYLIILRSKIQKQDKQLCHFKEDNITVFKIPQQLVYYADFYIDKDLSKHAK